MAITTITITDRNFRITIPEDVRIAEGLRVGDTVQLDVTRIERKKPLPEIIK